MKRTLLIVGGGIETIPGVIRAKEMGLRILIIDGNPKAPCFELADDYRIASTYDVDAVVKSALDYHTHSHKIDGVMCIASDIPHTVASVAAALNLPGVPVPIAFMMVDKLAMKDHFAKHGIPIPWYQAIKSVDELKSIVEQRGYDLVIKPVDSRGARGVLRLSSDIDLDWAFSHSHSESPSHRVMVEQFLAGPQVSTESIVQNGKAYTLGFSDRNYEFLDRYAPHIIENGGDLPGHMIEEVREMVCNLIQNISDALGLQSGVIKGDIVIHQGRPHVIEVATRLSGGYFCTHEIPLNTGVDFVGGAIKLALGESISENELAPQFNRPVCQRYLFTQPGEIISIEGVEEVASRPSIKLCEVRVKVGDMIPEVSNHVARPGVVIAVGDTTLEAREQAESAIRDIKINTR